MADHPHPLTTWPQIHQAAAHHPYVLTFGPVRETPRAYRLGDAVVWFVERHYGVVAAVHGPKESCRRLVLALDALGELAGVRRVIVPLDVADLVPEALGLRTVEEWEFLWTTSAPPPQPGEPRLAPLGAEYHDQINDLLDVALPESMARPGYPGVRAWYGIPDGDRLLACGAEISRGVVPGLAGIAVRPEARGTGLGAAVTAYLTRRLLPEQGLVGLGVILDNAPGRGLYRRLGYTDSVLRATCQADPDAPATTAARSGSPGHRESGR